MDESGNGETSSLDAAEGRTDLIKSSEANRSSLRLRCLPIAPEFVSVDSWAMTRTGVGVADLAVFGLNRSYNHSVSAPTRYLTTSQYEQIEYDREHTVLVKETFPLPIFSNSAFHSAPFLTGAWLMISGFVNDNFSNRARISSSVMSDMLGIVLSERAKRSGVDEIVGIDQTRAVAIGSLDRRESIYQV